jgi:hypothetical protein
MCAIPAVCVPPHTKSRIASSRYTSPMPSMSVCSSTVLLAPILVLSACQSDPGPQRLRYSSNSLAQANDVLIDCTVEPEANRCTVRGTTGVLLYSGSCLLDQEGRPASFAELRYSAFRDHQIHLAGDRSLYPVDEPKRSLSGVDLKLALLSRSKLAKPRNCGQIGVYEDPSPANECVRRAVQDKAPFKVSYFAQGIDDWEYFGLAGNSAESVYLVSTGQDLSSRPPDDSEPPVSTILCASPLELRTTGAKLLRCDGADQRPNESPFFSTSTRH